MAHRYKNNCRIHPSCYVKIDMVERVKLCLLLKRNFGAGVKQIARLTRLSPVVVEKVV